MNVIKKERSKSYNYQNSNYAEIPKERSRGMSTLSSKHSGRELGVVEKLLSSYGFVQPTGEGTSIFFHYSEFIGDINTLQLGESLSFLIRSDRRSGKPVAVQLARASSIPPQVNGYNQEQTVLSYSVKGVVEVQARLATDNGYHPNLASVGRVAYEKDGATFFLPYSSSDVDNGHQPRRGDRVIFSVVQDKMTRDLHVKQMRVLETDDDASDSGNESSYTGVISSLKDAFGFIERGDVVSEIFFHYSQFDGDRSDLIVGADVGFDIQTRNGKEVAANVVRLPSGSVVFEDESTEVYKGEVVKIANRGRLNSSMSDDQLNGVIEYTDHGDLVDITYSHRDISQNATLRVGDMVEFKVSTDRRDGLQRAVNVTPVHCHNKQTNGHQRELGVVCNLREGFGFIKCCDRDINVFFHFSEVMDKMSNLNLSDEVEFSVEKDESGRLSASKISLLPKGSVEFEELSEDIYEGVVKREPNGLGSKSPSKGTKDSELGIITFYDEEEDEDVEFTFKPRDCKPREFPQVGDEVEFYIATNKRNNQQSAKEVSVLKRHRSARQKGFVCAMKENYGFIETADHTTDVFFHFSESDSKVDDLCLGDEVGFTVVRKNGKQCAEDVKRLKKGTIPQEDVLDGVYEGKVIRPVRTVDPDQPTYEGSVAKVRSKVIAMDEKRSEAETSLSAESSLVEEDEEQPEENQQQQQQQQECYPFGITSLVDKKDPLHPGDKVTFQLGIDKDGVQRAVCIRCVREVLRARVESIKGQFGFIAHETADGKNLFFHMSEVDDSGGLVDPGDMVEFIIVKSHKNAKLSAMRVKRISDSPKPGHLLRRRDNTPNKATFIAIRVPTIPDGTIGFKNRKSGDR